MRERDRSDDGSRRRGERVVCAPVMTPTVLAQRILSYHHTGYTYSYETIILIHVIVCVYMFPLPIGVIYRKC